MAPTIAHTEQQQQWLEQLHAAFAQQHAPDGAALPPPQYRVTNWRLAWRVVDDLLVLVRLRADGLLAIYPSALPTGLCYLSRVEDEPLRWGPWCDSTGALVTA